MKLSDRFDPRVVRRVRGGTLSVALHVALLLVILSGGRTDGLRVGDTPVLELWQIDLPDTETNASDAEEMPLPEPAAPPLESGEELQAAIAGLTHAPADVVFPDPSEMEQPAEPSSLAIAPLSIDAYESPPTRAMSGAEKAALAQRLERLAEESANTGQTRVAWQQDGRNYSAVLIHERAGNGTALERVVAQVSASDRGKFLTTTVNLRRLAFSQFSQIVNRWDPLVQLHDDEVVGRFHSNSRINVLADGRTRPKFLGKVTTTARTINTQAPGRRGDSDIFQGGVETGANRIALPETLQPFAWAPRNPNARIHEFAKNAHIRFFSDGSYRWRVQGSPDWQYVNEATRDPVYFVAAPDATLYVRGIVRGRVLVYSPRMIVIEGSLTYASDPRESPDSGDYVGLVSDNYVQVATPSVTGPGDLEIDAAIFAGRRFVVTEIEHPRKATLRIYGSLTAGSLTATEPRYATKIEYDTRFERERPPGFPSTNRFEAADWSGEWVEMPATPKDDPST